MRIEDNGAGLSPYSIEYAANYTSPDAMLEASERYRQQGKVSILLGLSSAILGAVVHERGGRKHNDDLYTVGLGIAIGGLVEILNGIRQQGTSNLHSQGARDISWAMSEKTATLLPDH